MMPTILITGGAGFIGSALCRYLVTQQLANVVNVDVLTYAANLSSLATIAQYDNYSFEQADITDKDAMTRIFQKYQPTGVMHLAAESHVDRSITGAQAFINTNITGTAVLLDVCLSYWQGLSGEHAKQFRLLHVSTDEVYGSLGATGLFHETTAYDPSSPYSASKAAADHLVNAWHRTYQLPALISNCSNNYGPYHFPEKLIPLIILNGLHQKELPVYGDGSNIRDWLYVEDHVRALWLVWQRGKLGEKYNIGGRNEYTNLEVVQKICQLLDEMLKQKPTGGHASLIRHVTDRPGHDERYAIDANKLEQELGWQAQENFSSGLRKTVNWYLSNQDWWQPILQNKYAGERLGI